MKKDCSQTDCMLRDYEELSIKLWSHSARLHDSSLMKRTSKINTVYWYHFLIYKVVTDVFVDG